MSTNVCEGYGLTSRVKSELLKSFPRLYLAGRISKERLRWGIVGNEIDHPEGTGGSISTVRASLSEHAFVYTGPFVYREHEHCFERHGGSKRAVVSRSMAGIEACDLFVAWIDDDQCHGTLVEIGYASAIKKPSVIIASRKGIDELIGELWFSACAVDNVFVASRESPREGLLELFLEARRGRFAGYGTYSEYLRSPRWKDTREGALTRAGGHCQLCRSTKSLNVHHNTYERVGNELPEDLVVLCRKHHEAFHDGER